MHAPDLDCKAFDIENPPAPSAGAGGGGGLGLRPSESVTKLESLERAERAALAPAVVLKTGFYILVWYTFSTCLTLYNKTLLGDKLGKFPAPLLMNTVHFALQAALSKIILLFQANGLDGAVEMSWKDYFMRVIPTALGTALDINLSNASLVFITVTFATMCKSASPIFLLLFAFAFRLESPSIKLLGIIVVISIGVLLTVARETDFDFWGFIFVTLAAVISGFRWSMTQILLQGKVAEKTREVTLHTEDIEDSICAVKSMAEFGLPIADDMIKDINKSLKIMSKTQPRRGLIHNPIWGFQSDKSSEAWDDLGAANGGSGRNYLSSMFNTAKQKASSLRWPPTDLATNDNVSEKSVSTTAPESSQGGGDGVATPSDA